MSEHTTNEPLRIDLMIESTGGGSMRHVRDLHDALCARGHDLRMIVSLMRAEPAVQEWLAALPPERVIRADTPRAPHPRDLPLVLDLRRRLKAEGGERLLHAHSTKAGILAAMLRGCTAGMVLTPHAYRGMDPALTPMRRRVIGLAEAAFSMRMDHVIAVSPEEEEYARDLGVRSERISYIPNGIDVPGLEAQAVALRAAEVPVPRNPPVLGFVGRFTRQKNPLLFIETFTQLRRAVPELRAVMIGDGEMMGALQARRTELGLEAVLDLPGALDFTREMQRMDVLVHTSLYESLPYVLLEAGAGGLAVVAVRNAGSEAVWPGAGLTEHTPEALTAAVLPLLTSQEALEAARARSRAGAARFSIEEMAMRTEAVYRMAAQRGRISQVRAEQGNRN